MFIELCGMYPELKFVHHLKLLSKAQTTVGVVCAATSSAIC